MQLSEVVGTERERECRENSGRIIQFKTSKGYVTTTLVLILFEGVVGDLVERQEL